MPLLENEVKCQATQGAETPPYVGHKTNPSIRGLIAFFVPAKGLLATADPSSMECSDTAETHKPYHTTILHSSAEQLDTNSLRRHRFTSDADRAGAPPKYRKPMLKNIRFRDRISQLKEISLCIILESFSIIGPVW